MALVLFKCYLTWVGVPQYLHLVVIKFCSRIFEKCTYVSWEAIDRLMKEKDSEQQ